MKNIYYMIIKFIKKNKKQTKYYKDKNKNIEM